jgi:branched-chain amino acid transport system substrate-binding protein
MPQLTRRTALQGLALTAIATPALAAGKTVKIGLNLPFTGAAADTASMISHGAALAIDDINAAGGAGGYQLVLMTLDDGTVTAGQYDPAQAAINARKMITDPEVMAAVGPMNSGSAKAMCPILSAAGLAIITPSATNPDMTNPAMAQIYRPGKLTFFRTVTTDAYQSPNMVNYFVDVLKLTSVVILDDGGAYGVGLADKFEAQARKRGMTVLARDRLDPKQPDYSAALYRLKALNPQALYAGSDQQAGVKIVKQSYDVMPGVVKAGGDGFFSSEILKAGGAAATEGWYATLASPHVMEEQQTQDFVTKFVAKYSSQPADYTITAYDAVMVIADAITRVAAAGPITREAVRAAIASAHVKTLQGDVAFDANGDLASRVISVFQAKYNASFPTDDLIHQFKYIGVAPEG